MVAFVTGCVFFVLASTAYLPRYLVSRLEAQYPPFAFSADDDSSEVVTIHVLGGGYTYDPRLPELAQLSPPSAGRLAEGLRISRYFRNSRLVFSGWRVSGPESMAMVMKVAAESLGAEPSHISLLEDARTTQQEARDLALMYGSNLDLILVTDAVHMPRAMRLFEAEGFRPHAAPANFLVRENDDDQQFKWVPSGRNIQLMDRALREFSGNVKAMVFG